MSELLKILGSLIRNATLGKRKTLQVLDPGQFPKKNLGQCRTAKMKLGQLRQLLQREQSRPGDRVAVEYESPKRRHPFQLCQAGISNLCVRQIQLPQPDERLQPFEIAVADLTASEVEGNERFEAGI